MHRPPRPPEQLGDEGGAGGFAVRTGDAIHRTGTERQEKLQFTGDCHTPAAGFGELRGIELHAGGAEEHLLGDVPEVIGAQHEPASHLSELPAEVAQFLKAAAVPDGEPGSGSGILTDQLPMADTHSDKADGAGLDHAVVLFQCKFHRKRFLSDWVKIGILSPFYSIPDSSFLAGARA